MTLTNKRILAQVMKLFALVKSKSLNAKAMIDNGIMGKTTLITKYFLKEILVKPAA